jgi:hypothetical protein
MPVSHRPDPREDAITQSGGPITEFFRLRWEEIRTALGLCRRSRIPARRRASPRRCRDDGDLHDSGRRRRAVRSSSWSVQRTQIDGAASSLQATIGWTQSGIAKTHVGRLMNTDSLAADPTDTPILISADQASDITIAIAYTSTTPGNCKYTYTPVVQRLA